jgi:osmotically-inducible protein OsmY
VPAQDDRWFRLHDDLGYLLLQARRVVERSWRMWQSKNDRDLERDVREELAFDPRVATKTITASAKDGVVTLSGSVTDLCDEGRGPP